MSRWNYEQDRHLLFYRGKPLFHDRKHHLFFPEMRFFVGCPEWQAKYFPLACVSVNSLRRRKGDFEAQSWIMDSGAFTEVSKNGGFRDSPEEYAAQINRWAVCGQMLAAVSQDWMCEPFVIRRTGLSIAEHQKRTVQRYDAIKRETPYYLMPVLQGFAPDDYLSHLAQYGSRLVDRAWVGVGSVCKRNSTPESIEDVLSAIKRERPDLRLHGFGVKKTALRSPAVAEALYSSDSMAWNFGASFEARNAEERLSAACAYTNGINEAEISDSIQTCLFN